MKRRIVLLGPPASGKGSQAHLIFEKYGISPVSTGHLLRDEAEAASELGRKAADYTSRGELAPDELVLAVIEKWLQAGRTDYVFDGFPRTVQQARMLDPMLEKAQIPLEAVLYLKCDPATIVHRVLGRVVCSVCKTTFHIAGQTATSAEPACQICGGKLQRRTDDTLEVLEHRMAQYEEKTKPLVTFYREKGLLSEIEANDAVEIVFQEIERILNS